MEASLLFMVLLFMVLGTQRYSKAVTRNRLPRQDDCHWPGRSRITPALMASDSHLQKGFNFLDQPKRKQWLTLLYKKPPDLMDLSNREAITRMVKSRFVVALILKST